MSAPPDPGFLSRWARRKAEAQRGELQPAAPTPPVVQPSATVAPHADRPSAAAPQTPPAATAAAPGAPAIPPPTLDDVARLTRDSDFARFVARDVEPGVKNAAMRKLFSDPHFNAMDGLDVYIDDYHTPDPLPVGMLRRMAQAHVLGLFDDDKPPPPSAPDTAPTQGTAPHEDPDLQLQRDDAAGREGREPDRPGAGEDPAGQP
jgi:hypothetical protein